MIFASVSKQTSSDGPVVLLGWPIGLMVIGGGLLASDTEYVTDCYPELKKLGAIIGQDLVRYPFQKDPIVSTAEEIYDDVVFDMRTARINLLLRPVIEQINRDILERSGGWKQLLLVPFAASVVFWFRTRSTWLDMNGYFTFHERPTKESS